MAKKLDQLRAGQCYWRVSLAFNRETNQPVVTMVKFNVIGRRKREFDTFLLSRVAPEMGGSVSEDGLGYRVISVVGNQNRITLFYPLYRFCASRRRAESIKKRFEKLILTKEE